MWNAISLVQDLNSCRRVHYTTSTSTFLLVKGSANRFSYFATSLVYRYYFNVFDDTYAKRG